MKNPVPRAVVAVLLAREHLPFIRHWCLHHLDQGWKVFLYDNTGSQGSSRGTSVFKYGQLQQQSEDKRGNRYGRFTARLTDDEVSWALRKEVEDLGVEVVPWQPRDGAGRVVHGQVEAYVHFIREHGSDFKWAAFIDADEYLHLGDGLAWDPVLSEVEGLGCHRLMISGHVYESRWTRDGNPRVLQDLACCGMQVARNKNIVRPDKAIMADIHWGWRMEGSNQYATADPLQFYFRHYMGDQAAHGLSLNPPPPPQSEAESVPVRNGGSGLAGPAAVAWATECPPGLLPWRISVELEDFIRNTLPSLHASPRRILELGAGYSTLVWSEVFPEAAITAVEHDEGWLAKELGLMRGRANIEVLLAPLDPASKWYALFPDQLPEFDILLVDGPPGCLAPRVRGKAVALRGNLSPGALVILNNTDRKDEMDSLAGWLEAGLEIVDQSMGFTVLRVPPGGAGDSTPPLG